MKHVLFLCTGNYYRSRFAECLFNSLAETAGLSWHADSCGLRVQPDGVVNHGPISIFARAALAERNIPLAEPCRFPRQVCGRELDSADMVIALKEQEHRPMMEQLHPDRANRVIYWHVHDLDVAPPAAAMEQLETLVRDLVRQLQ